ncbi:MAG: RagB/SusD family nutrient uptake outer membrane protein [Ferruginibacter sp.]|nr:RagB/SusD family nutrient uptake outer membrane protein [Ferruginibacter sp.]
MKKYINILLVMVVFLLTVSSCKKDFLKEDVYSSYAPETLADSLGFEASLTGLYNHFSNFYTYSDNQGWLSVWQVGTDVAFSIPSQTQGVEVPYSSYNSLISTDFAASYTWSFAYRMINNANVIIANVENPNLGGMSQPGKDAIDAEARFFRGYAYNMLATLYGRVPLITAPITVPKTDFVRASLDSINNQVALDLNFAATKLPDIDNVKSNSKGKMYERVSKYAAQQLLAEAYLRMGKNDLAEQQAQAVISSGKFSLITSRYGTRANQPGDPFSDMFIYGNERRSQGNKEAIWVLEMENPSTVPGGITNNPQQRRIWGAAYYQITGMKIADSLGGRGISRLRLSNWVLYGLYPPGDMRNSKYNIRRQYWYNDPASPKYGQPVPYTGSDTLFRLTPNTTKWYDLLANNSDGEFGFAMTKDIILMRLGETYLLLAEALVKQGKLQAAADAINMLRTRAAAPQVTAAEMTLDFILDERARELIGEENRRMTLMRTGKLVERALALNANNGTGTTPITGLTSKNLLLPIPKSEVDLNKDAKLDQNPGY